MFSKNNSYTVLVIEYWNLIFICNLLARRLSGGVLVYWFFIMCKEMTIKTLR
jgi:hypothetical protein